MVKIRDAIDFYFRAALACFWFLLSSGITLCLLPFSWKNPDIGYLFARLLDRPGLFILGLRTKVEGAAHLRRAQPCIYIANHQSNLDILTLARTYSPRTVVIGKKELRWLPLFGLLFIGAGNIVIDRKNRADALSGLDAAAEAVREKKLSVWIFPEGTRNRGRRELLPFKKGAFHLAIRAQVPIVPIVQQHLRRYFDHERRKLRHEGVIPIRVLEPIPTEGLTLKDLDALIATTRQCMQAVLNEPRFAPPEMSAEPLAKPLAKSDVIS